MNFIKMHGAGNDFVILDQRDGGEALISAQITHICDRHFGVGCDQLIILEPSSNADLFMRVYNPDGSQSGACGNATRCVADLSDVQTIETLGGTLKTRRVGDLIEVDMGIPKLIETPFTEVIDGLTSPVLVDMGNPHAVYVVDKLADITVKETGHHIETHPFFPDRTNVEFVQVNSRTHIRQKTWERGAGLTLACGSGACAAAVACIEQGLTERKLDITLDGGTLHMEWRETDGHILMTGPTARVFDGELRNVEGL